MENIDIKYICNIMGNLSGIPIRIYKDNDLFYYYSIINLPKDPIEIYKEKLFSIKESVGYYITPHFDYYGIVLSNKYRIILGPSRMLPPNDQDLKDLAFNLEISKDDLGDFISGMKSIITMPLDSIIQIMSVLNYVLNKEKKSIKDLSIEDNSQIQLKNDLEKKEAINNINNQINYYDKYQHNTLTIEESLMNIIKEGNTLKLKDWIDNAPSIRSGQLASHEVRHMKNTFIVSATLASRAAIRGGLSIEESLSLSDAYIQRCESLQTINEITNLQFRMICDYTERVEKIKKENLNSELALEVFEYVKHHLSEPINTQKMANDLFISRSGLSTRFKKETNKTLTDFIMEIKIKEAKNILRYTEKSMLTISDYLGFSSQSHFIRSFQKMTGMTPSEYRKSKSK